MTITLTSYDILTYIEHHPEILPLIKKRFFAPTPPKRMGNIQKLLQFMQSRAYLESPVVTAYKGYKTEMMDMMAEKYVK